MAESKYPELIFPGNTQKLVSSIAATYNLAYIVNIKNDSFINLRADKGIIGADMIFSNFSEAKDFFLTKVCHPSDKENVAKILDYDFIREKLQSAESFDTEYRAIVGDTTIWHLMNITKIDEDSIAIGFVHKDVELTKLHLEERRYDEYFALFVVDMDTERMKILKNTGWFQEVVGGQSYPYKETMLKLGARVSGRHHKFIEKLADLDYVREIFAEDNKRAYEYFSNRIDGGRWVELTSYVTARHTDGSPCEFTLGFSLLDVQSADRQELYAKIAEEKKRNDILHNIIHSGKWSFFINAKDEIIRADYSDEVRHLVNNDFTEDIHSWIDILHPDDSEATLSAFNAAIADHSCRTPYDVVYRMRDRDGVYRWFHSAGRVVRDNDGNGEFFGVHIDVTDTVEEQQRRAAAQISKSMNMFFTLSNEYDPIIVVEPESGEYDWYMSMTDDVTANTSMTVHGDCLYKNIGIDGASIIHEEDRAQFRAFYTRENMMKIARTGETQETENRWFIQTEGRYKWKYNKAVRMMDESGKALVVIGVIDTTEKKEKEAALELERQQSQQRLQEALAMAQSASRAKTDFLFNMSHDIRTPMNAITGFTAIAKKNAGNKERVLDYLNKIDVSGQQLLMLINQVLEMAQIESGKIEFNEQPVNIKERFDAMVTVLGEQAEVHGLKFNTSLQNITHYNVLADDARMGQVTLNIAGNAMKYTQEGGSIDFIIKEIPARKEGRATFVFTVADTGIGMSEEFQKNLFEPFARESTSTVSKIQGTGLGMSIVKSLVDLADGKIEVHSEQGKGTRFDVTWDLLIDEQPQKSEQHDHDATSFSFKGKRVLLVEDNALNREIAKYILEDKGVIVEDAEDGDIAVERIEDLVKKNDTGYYDFILMDVQMPRMNGYEATGRIRSILNPLGVHIPIIALSANAFEEDRQKSRDAGMDAHVAKPIDIMELMTTMARFI